MEAGAFVDAITFRNYGRERVDLPVELTLAGGFESIFVLRGTPPGKRGTMRAPLRRERGLRFEYLGADQIARHLDVDFSWASTVSCCTARKSVVHFELALEPQECKTLRVLFQVRESTTDFAMPTGTIPDHRDYREAMRREWLSGFAEPRSPESVLNETLERSLNDIRMLRISREGHPCTAAGMPWFVGVFGRDSVIPALQCLAFNQDMAAHTARILARHQGRRTDQKRHEEPGKILHEWRVGEMAHVGEVPATSYASIDSTLLFLILIARHAAWSGSLELFAELRENVDRALQWMRQCGDRNGDGYIEYYGKTDGGAPENQGWKDSGDAIVREDGSFPSPPISLIEVQGYAYLAKRELANLFLRAGDRREAERLTREAQSLRERFNRDFWMEQKGCYCLGLEGGGQQISVITSNAGHVLWTGIADPEKAKVTQERLMQADMFSGWGVRTLSSDALRYNPFAYQLGSIWPFDNALILAGFRHYGFDAAACRIFESQLAAAKRFTDDRLPEFFAGTARGAGFAPASGLSPHRRSDRQTK